MKKGGQAAFFAMAGAVRGASEREVGRSGAELRRASPDLVGRGRRSGPTCVIGFSAKGICMRLLRHRRDGLQSLET